MNTSFAKSFGAVELQDILPLLAKSERACDALRDSLGSDRGSLAVEMFRSRKAEGDLENEIYDFFLDEIENEAEPVWEGELYDPEDPENPDGIYPIGINEYEGVFYVWALEYDNAGYFLSEEAASNYAFMNWDNIRESEKE